VWAGGGLGTFIADSNQFGYTGSVWNITKGTSASPNPVPRDATFYFVNNAPVSSGYIWGNYNEILSNWYQDGTSNQNPGFFQLADGNFGTGIVTATSATGAWTQNGSLWDFTVTVSGANANVANSVARLWQPDAGMAWGGTFTNYTYTLTATGMTTDVVDGWRYNTIDPTGITGSFDATFVSTQAVYGGDSNLGGRDTYGVHFDFSNTSWSGATWSDSYTDDTGTAYYGLYSTFGAPVPEPLTMLGVAAGVAGIGAYIRRRRAVELL